MATLQFYWANQLCLYLSSGIAKIAVAVVLYRLAMTVKSRLILASSIVVVVIWTTITTVFASDVCADNPTGVSNFAGSQMCSDVGYFRTVTNILIDYFFALFPIPMLWNAPLARQMKLVVCGLLGLGMLYVPIFERTNAPSPLLKVVVQHLLSGLTTLC